MTQKHSHNTPDKISPELDKLASSVFEESFNELAETKELWPLLAVEDEDGIRELISFTEDDKDQCVKAARAYLQMSKNKGIGQIKKPYRYALAYDAMVQEEQGKHLQAAVIVEFGESGSEHAYSGYSFYRHGKTPEDFLWTNPQAAGFEDLLL